jgi:hypothetical protein
MFTVCWSPKGGSGTTVVAASLAILSARHAPTVLVDLGGDAPAALGIGDAGDTGTLDWLGAPHATGDELWRLAVPAADDLQLIARGDGRDPRTLSVDDWERLAVAVGDRPDLDVVVDAGPTTPPDDVIDRFPSSAGGARSLLVVRPCYLALRRCVRVGTRPTGVVAIVEPGRPLGPDDAERALDVPVLATVPWDPAVARAVDARLVVSRLPQTISRPLRGLALGALR